MDFLSVAANRDLWLQVTDWTRLPAPSIIESVTQSIEQVVHKFRKAVAASRKNSSPAKAKAFLVRAGIAEKSKSSPSGVRLAKRFR